MSQPEEDEIKDYGLCPVCKKGHLYEACQGFSCDHFLSVDNKCIFTIFFEYYSHRITDDEIKQLCNEGQTEIIEDFKKKDGTPFASPARLKLQDGVVKIEFMPKKLPTPCPKCGGKIVVQLNGYACENYINKREDIEHRCLYIPKYFNGVELSQKDVTDLLSEKRTSFLEGFKSGNGIYFDARLLLTQEYNLLFDSVLCSCPKCGGNIFSGRKSYNCSNFKDETIKCNFTVWKEMKGRKIMPAEVIDLCTNNKSKLLYGFYTKDHKTYDAYLAFDENYKVVITSQID